jgi:hypothetical protein
MTTELPETFDPNSQKGTDECRAASIAEGKCSHCDAQLNALRSLEPRRPVDHRDDDQRDHDEERSDGWSVTNG